MEHLDGELGSIKTDLGPYFRETEPIELWSSIVITDTPFTDFERMVIKSAEETNQKYTGYITFDETNDVVKSFTLTKYPRKKYGVLSTEECEIGMHVLADKLGGNILVDPRQGGFRVVLGLVEGYGKDAPVHSLEEIQKALPNCEVSPAEVFSAWPNDQKISTYREPVAIINGSLKQIKEVYSLADELKQERFTVEDFGHNASYVVETRHCTEPD